MRYKEVARTIDCDQELYVGRVVSKKTNLFQGAFGKLRKYYLEVRNINNGKSKRVKLGYGGVDASNPGMPIFYDVTVQSINFTERGLEVILRGESEMAGVSSHNISEGKVVLLPRDKFPN